MEIKELYEQYKVKKLAFEKAKKEEEKYKNLLKDAMKEAGEAEHTDTDGYTFVRSVQNRKSMNEAMVLEALHERGLTSCIKLTEAVDEDAVMAAINAGEFPVEELQKALTVKEVVTLTLKAPGKSK